MSFISKVELKYQLQKMGINIIEGNYIRKKDIKKAIAHSQELIISLQDPPKIGSNPISQTGRKMGTRRRGHGVFPWCKI